jgi:hypothetical protein
MGDAESDAWLDATVDRASRTLRKAAGDVGRRGSIPFMGMLGERYPRRSSVGVLGPHSNAHKTVSTSTTRRKSRLHRQ